MKKLKLILHSKYVSIFLLLLVLSYIGYSFVTSHSVYETETYFEGVIVSKKIGTSNITFEVKAREKLLVSCKIQDCQTFVIGDKIALLGNLEKPSSNRNFHLFNYASYLKGRHIFWTVKAQKITLKKKATGLYRIKNQLIKRIEEQDNAAYLKAFLLGDSSQLEKKGLYQELGISHLFAISGMHIVFLSSFLFKICSKIKKRVSFWPIILILGLYVWMLGENASANRAYLLFILSFLNREYHWKFHPLQLLLFVFSTLIIQNPFAILQTGFQFSFLICFFLILQKKEETSYLKGLFKTSLLASLVSFPLSAFHFHQFHFGAVFFNMIAVPLVSFFLFPLSIICFFLPFFHPLFGVIVTVFHFVLDQFSILSFLKLSFMAFPFYYYMMYYVILVLFFCHSKKWLYIYLFLIIIHFCYPYMSQDYWIDMIDVGQGDAILIRYPHLSKTILVDTGGLISYQDKKSSYSQVDSIFLPYFHSLGVTKIDVLILTHGDADHMGNALTLLQKFPVKLVLMNKGSDTELEKQVLSYLKKASISVLQIDKQVISIGNHPFQFLNQVDYENENEDSLVFFTNLASKNILFMGDAGKKTEKQILEEYNLPKMDILKVGHHGSKNSTSNSFLDNIKPFISLISSGVNNHFNHPHQEVLELLSFYQSHIYTTKEVGAIRLRLRNGIFVQTCLS